MKRILVYTFTLALLMAALAGCGNMRNDYDLHPGTTADPLIGSPDPGDGMVNDHDGIITDDDNGLVNVPDLDTEPVTTPASGNTAGNGNTTGNGTTAGNGTTGERGTNASASPSASPANNG